MSLAALRTATVSFVTFLANLSGWKRLGVAFVFGSLMTLTMPPFGFFPLLWLCLPVLIVLLHGTTKASQAFWTGWFFAFGFFVFGLYWIASAMFVELDRFWWAIPFSVAGLPAFLSLYYGVAAVVARRINLASCQGVILFGLLWFVAEYARGHLASGFPWILLGYAWSDVLPVLQITSVVGIYGLTLITTVAASLPAIALLMLSPAQPSSPLRQDNTSALLTLGAGVAAFCLIASWGAIRLATTDVKTFPNVYARLVQPNTQQKNKWLASERDRNFDDLLTLSSSPSARPVTHIFWPETASPHYLTEDPFHRKEIAERIPFNAPVVTGIVRRSIDAHNTLSFYNSVTALDSQGRLVATYDKAHLVPFGEYLPFRHLLPSSLRAIAASSVDFSSGPGPRSLHLPGLPPFSPLICYEVIFPAHVLDPNDRPAFLVNATNDAWYGRSSGPFQHFAIARVRAIEEGLTLLRIANTGISGIVDPMGRIEKELGLDQKGVIDGVIRKPLSRTFFSVTKEYVVWIGFLFLLIPCVSGLKKSHTKK